MISLYNKFILNWSLTFNTEQYIHSSVSYMWNVDGMYVLVGAPWCGVETPWVNQVMGGGRCGLPRVTRSVARSVVYMILAGRIFDHGRVYAGCVWPAC
jgi:hypothetical protein